MKRGLFISVEGIDGAGKSTHVEFMRDYLINKGYTVILTREPGGTSLGERIRELLLGCEKMHPNTELLLYFASRQEILNQVICPNLAEGNCVIADRFIDASIAYQGGGRMLGVDKVKQVYSLLDPVLKTDATFLFDVPLELAMKRLKRAGNLDRIELESSEFFTRVQNTYHMLAKENPERIKVISTAGLLEDTRKILTLNLDRLMERFQ